jgi:hypothetical protein
MRGVTPSWPPVVERALEAFLAHPVLALLLVVGALLAFEDEPVLVDAQLDVVLVAAGQLGVDHEALVGLAHVHEGVPLAQCELAGAGADAGSHAELAAGGGGRAAGEQGHLRQAGRGDVSADPAHEPVHLPLHVAKVGPGISVAEERHC